MGLQTEVPLVALPRLVHLGVALARLVHGRTGLVNHRRIHNRACRDTDASLIQMQVHFLQHRWAQPVLQQMADVI